VLEAAELLLQLGADVNAVDKNGETAMHGAAYKNLPKVVEFLAAHGAKIDVWNKKNKSGWTPLKIAEGYRPGNFKPSAETIEAIQRVMRAAGVEPPGPTETTAAGVSSALRNGK
jgi:ankyrin repeat protein